MFATYAEEKEPPEYAKNGQRGRPFGMIVVLKNQIVLVQAPDAMGLLLYPVE